LRAGQVNELVFEDIVGICDFEMTERSSVGGVRGLIESALARAQSISLALLGTIGTAAVLDSIGVL
jgi:hypothetical protein